MKPTQRKSWIVVCLVLVGVLFLVSVLYGFLRAKLATSTSHRLGIIRVVYSLDTNYLVVEALDDDLLHFEFVRRGELPGPDQAIAVSPMVGKTDYPGPRRFTHDGQGHMETADLKVTITAETLCVAITDKTRQPALLLTQLCPDTKSPMILKNLTLTAESMGYIYGLGEQFVMPAEGSLNWVGQMRKPIRSEGNAMQTFFEGYVGNAQFPIFYALNEKGGNYALFVDSPYAQTWDFRSEPWQLRASGPALRWYVMSGPDLPNLRQDYLELVGHPPVPAKKFFGLWLSEYGYDNWDELDDKLRTLRDNHFPIDGFVMDLQWFGNIVPAEASQMGNLAWDTVHFPEPALKIAALAAEGIGVMTIEESYIATHLPEFTDLQQQDYLVKAGKSDQNPTIFQDAWWGSGGMLDWTNPAAGDYWHDRKRQPLVEMGVIGHWTDLGEPEYYNSDSYYYGFPDLDLHSQADVHNLYNLLWSESLVRGYTRHGVEQRPFILSRSGTSGSQRYHVAMWSGDIGTNLISLAAHLQAQAHMSFSGLDYFGSDIGGFHRGGAKDTWDDVYTKWLAVSALIDVPVRPHTENLCNCKETAPDRIGDAASNLANVRLRYALSPYLYTLAHRAYLYGEPTVPPLVFYYQTDPNAHDLADEKLLGRDLLLAPITQPDQTARDVYLPAGTWINFYTHEWVENTTGTWIQRVTALQGGVFRLPLFARAGALIPMMAVDEQTMDIFGLRRDGTRRDELIVRAYASANASSFTLYEDDGRTLAYQQGQVRTTQLSQQLKDQRAEVTIAASAGAYPGALEARANVVELVFPRGKVAAVALNGQALPQLNSLEAFAQAEQGWFQAGDHLVLAKSRSLAVTEEKRFRFDLAE